MYCPNRSLNWTVKSANKSKLSHPYIGTEFHERAASRQARMLLSRNAHVGFIHFDSVWWSLWEYTYILSTSISTEFGAENICAMATRPNDNNKSGNRVLCTTKYDARYIIMVNSTVIVERVAANGCILARNLAPKPIVSVFGQQCVQG